jgi:hypothetical protein
MSITSSKMKGSFLTEVQIFVHQLASVNFLSLSFEKKAKKSKFLNSIAERKKKQFRKKFFYKVLISIGRINVQKIRQIGDGLWSLGRFLQKTVLKKISKFSNSEKSSE